MVRLYYTLLYKNGVKLNNVGRPKKISLVPSENKAFKKAVKLNLVVSDSNAPSALREITKEIVKNNLDEDIDSLVEKVLSIVCQRLKG